MTDTETDHKKHKVEPTELSIRTLLDKLPLLMRGINDSVLDGVIYFRLGSEKWREIKDALVDYGLNLYQQPLGELVPVLKEMRDCDFRTQRWLPHGTEPLQSRIRNALLENGIRELGDLAAVRVMDIQRLDGFGGQSIRNLMGFLIEIGISICSQDQVLSQTTSVAESDPESQYHKDSLIEAMLSNLAQGHQNVEGQHHKDSMTKELSVQEEVAGNITEKPRFNFIDSDELSLIARWEIYRGKGTILGEIFDYKTEGYTPPEVEKAASKLLSVNLKTLMPTVIPVVTLIDEILMTFDEKVQYVLIKRVFSPEPITLDNLGQEFGVTRERIRQIQKRAERTIYQKLAQPHFIPIKWVAMEFRKRIGDLAPLKHPLTTEVIENLLPGDKQPHHIQMLLNLAGYEISEGWLSTTNLDRIKSHLNTFLVEAADEFGVLPENHEVDILKQLCVDSELHQAVLTSLTKISKRAGRYVIWQNSVVDKAVTLLSLRERPADIHTLISEMNESYNATGARDRLSADPRVMRVNKTEFGLRSWGLEEYSGINEEICERIARDGGSAEFEGLVAEVVSTFGVAEGSVRMYCAAPMFIVKDGMIELSATEDYLKVSENITGVKGAYKPDANEVSMIVSIDKDTLRGSGRSLMPTLTAALKVQPGEERIYKGLNGNVRITWPMTSALGGSRGSVRDFVLSLNAREGDRVLLVFDTEQMTVRYSLVDENLIREGPSLEAIAELTGVHAENAVAIIRKLATAVEVDQKSLRKTLVDRGDVEVVSSLPENIASAELTHALEELAGAFGED